MSDESNKKMAELREGIPVRLSSTHHATFVDRIAARAWSPLQVEITMYREVREGLSHATNVNDDGSWDYTGAINERVVLVQEFMMRVTAENALSFAELITKEANRSISNFANRLKEGTISKTTETGSERD
jgi:hypothetical protein